MRKPQPWDGRCQRCGQPSDSFTGSWYSTQLLCLSPCAEEEAQHPDFEYVRSLEHEAVRRGDMNWSGPFGGWPGVDGRVLRPHSVTDEDNDS